jgi:alanine dehydrogenase
MKIGVVKEIKADEYRVALTPAGARELVRRGHDVLVETGAGEGSAFPDGAFEAVGARLGSVEQVWSESELVLKVKEPLPSEYPRLRDDLVLFTYLHLAANRELTETLVASGASCVAYETVETANGALPLLAPMSEIAGRLAAQAGAHFLEKPLGGRGLLLSGVPGVAPGRVLVLGGGIVGYNAAVIAIGLGGNVTILERSIDRMRHLDEILSGRVSLVMSSTLQIESSIAEADLVIGAVLVPGAVAPSAAVPGTAVPGTAVPDTAVRTKGVSSTAGRMCRAVAGSGSSGSRKVGATGTRVRWRCSIAAVGSGSPLRRAPIIVICATNMTI